jgi:hypothetical protein
MSHSLAINDNHSEILHRKEVYMTIKKNDYSSWPDAMKAALELFLINNPGDYNKPVLYRAFVENELHDTFDMPASVFSKANYAREYPKKGTVLTQKMIKEHPEIDPKHPNTKERKEGLRKIIKSYDKYSY